MKKGDKGKKVFGLIVILAIIVSVFGGAVSAEDVSGGLKQSVDAAEIQTAVGNLSSADYNASIDCLSNTRLVVPFFSHRDPQWKDDLMGSSGQTIGQIGCAMTCTAMLLKYYGVSTDPGMLNAWLSTHGGYTSSGAIYWAKPAEYSNGKMEFDSMGGSIIDNDNWGVLNDELSNGYPVIVQVDAYPSTPALDSHWVLVTGREGSQYYINDPWDLSYSSKLLSHYYDSTYDNTFFGWRVYHGSSVSTPPSPPTLTSPGTSSEPGEGIDTLTPIFRWQAVSGADQYGLYISKYPYGSSNIVYENEAISGSSTSLPLPSGYLQDGVKYRWNMRAHNSAGWSSYGIEDGKTRLYFWVNIVPPNQVKGIDVSEYQGNINWPTVYDSGYRFAFARASLGDENPPTLIDDYFETNMENGHAAGMLMGAYHFAYPNYGTEASSEARHFLNVAGEYLKEGYLRPVLDLERGEELGKESLSNWVHEWMNTVKSETGIEPIIYVNSNYAKNYLDSSVTKYNLWIAHWTYNPSTYPNTGIWASWDFWQYSDKGSVPGISGDVDLDIFNGDMDRLYTFVIESCDGTATSCGIYPNCENCNEDDNCYPYDNGCEERNYYCVSNEAGCGYTYSNRHTDCYDAWDYYCDGDTVRRHRLFHNYYCDGGTCTDHTSLVDDQLVENCNDRDDWVDTGNTDWVPDPGNDCQEKEQKKQEYRDYCCSGGACTYSVTDTHWIDTGTTQNKDDGTICGCTASNTLKRCYGGVCNDIGICDSTTCGADASCDGKRPGDSCGGGTCDSNCKCGGQAVGEDYAIFSAPLWFVDTNGDHLADDVFGYGFAGATPLVGDINQDGTDDIAVFSAPIWFVDTNGDHLADDIFGYGFAGATPLVGDINQDGTDDIAVFSDGLWFVDTNGDHLADDVFGYGFAGATPLVGDFNQDGTDGIAVYSAPLWFVDTNGDHLADDVFGYGFAGATPLVGDINQDGTDDIAVFSDGLWFVDTNGDHLADDVFGYGFAGATPIVGDIG